MILTVKSYQKLQKFPEPTPQELYNESDIEKIKKHKKRYLNQALCSICLNQMDLFSNEDAVRKLPCGHCYHLRCIRLWINEGKDKCPVCSQKIFQVSDQQKLLELENQLRQLDLDNDENIQNIQQLLNQNVELQNQQMQEEDKEKTKEEIISELQSLTNTQNNQETKQETQQSQQEQQEQQQNENINQKSEQHEQIQIELDQTEQQEQQIQDQQIQQEQKQDIDQINDDELFNQIISGEQTHELYYSSEQEQVNDEELKEMLLYPNQFVQQNKQQTDEQNIKQQEQNQQEQEQIQGQEKQQTKYVYPKNILYGVNKQPIFKLQFCTQQNIEKLDIDLLLQECDVQYQQFKELLKQAEQNQYDYKLQLELYKLMLNKQK